MRNLAVRLAVVVFGLLLSFGVAARAPVVAVILGLAIAGVAGLYIVKASVRGRIDGLLGREGRSPLLGKLAALGIGAWALLVLVGVGIQTAITGGSPPTGSTATPVVTSGPTSGAPPVVKPQEEVEACAPGLTRWGRAVDPDSGTERLYCGVSYEVIGREDNVAPNNNIQVGQVILVAETVTREELGELLEYVYASSRATVMADPRELKEVYAWVYPSRRRAQAGNGEWLAMIGETGTGTLPPRERVIFKLPPANMEKPTAEEDAIYDAFWEEFSKDEREENEARVERAIAERNGLSVKDFKRIYTEVFAYRNAGG